MDGQVFQGRKPTVIFAEENRKKLADMRSRERRLAEGEADTVTADYCHRVTTLHLRTMRDLGLVAVSIHLLPREGINLGRFHLEEKGIVENDCIHAHR
ncbi:hypothetical protein HanIR_Chr11g0546321 [Helianthus annuus]|nr:hypothetical protein HanIR_Chr11g0546321 [Helianthus annuus]